MYRIVLDTETAGSIENHKTLRVYDFGFAVLDEEDNIVRVGNWIVREVFYNSFMMSGAYYANKLPKYHDEIRAAVREVKNFGDIRRDFLKICKEYSVSQVWAFNASFDRDALNATTNALSNGILDEFLTAGIVWCDIQAAAATLICNTKRYYEFAYTGNYVSKAGNCRTNAETIYRFISGDNDFVEAHTGLEDVLIEAAILHACRVKHQRMERGCPVNAWRIPQRGFKAYVSSL